MRLNLHRYACLCCLATSLVTSASGLVIAGSDLLGPGIQDALQSEAQTAGLDVELSLRGSLLGSRDLGDGKADAAILAVPGDASLEAGSARQYPFAFQVVTFAVHANNPLSEVTYTQLTNLYGEAGVLDPWTNLTPDPEWRDRNIALWATRIGQAINLEIFNAVVLKGSPLKQSVRYSSGDADQLNAIVLEDPSALVLVPWIPLTAGVRLLAVKEDQGGQAYTPSPDNVFFGDYPLRLPFVLAVAETVSGEELDKLLQVVYSPAVTDAIEAAYFQPIPDTERRSILSRP